jgi:hypothetical protein
MMEASMSVKTEQPDHTQKGLFAPEAILPGCQVFVINGRCHVRPISDDWEEKVAPTTAQLHVSNPRLFSIVLELINVAVDHDGTVDERIFASMWNALLDFKPRDALECHGFVTVVKLDPVITERTRQILYSQLLQPREVSQRGLEGAIQAQDHILTRIGHFRALNLKESEAREKRMAAAEEVRKHVGSQEVIPSDPGCSTAPGGATESDECCPKLPAPQSLESAKAPV